MVTEKGSCEDQSQSSSNQHKNRWSFVFSIPGQECQRSQERHDDGHDPVCVLFGRQKVRIDSEQRNNDGSD